MRRFKIEFIRVLILMTGFIVANLLGIGVATSALALSFVLLVCFKPITAFIEIFFGEFVGE